MGTWTQVAENLVRHQGGTIYLRAKVAGKVIRVSLDTKDLRIAKIKRDEELERVRKAATPDSDPTKIRTLGDALDAITHEILDAPELEESTRAFYKDIFALLRRSLPLATPARAWTATEARAWWRAAAANSAAQRANHLLGVVKRVGKMMLATHVRSDDPTAGLKRRKIVKRQLNMPSAAVMNEIIENIRSQGKAHSQEAADYVQFLAYAGCRRGQAQALTWADVGEEWIEFRAGVEGSKGAKTRRLPISGPLREAISRLRQLRKGDAKEKAALSGPVFKLKSPRNAFENACERLGVHHLRIHDLRHFFATYALECGVDVPTVSKWLGHKDGGVLVLQTYGHLRDEHSLASVEKLRQTPAPVTLTEEKA